MITGVVIGDVTNEFSNRIVKGIGLFGEFVSRRTTASTARQGE